MNIILNIVGGTPLAWICSAHAELTATGLAWAISQLAGFADFALVAFHFQKTAIVAQSMIPVLYAAAMASGALSSLVFGRMLDKLGLPVLLLAILLSALFAPFVFLGGFTLALIGMVLWGIAGWASGLRSCPEPRNRASER